jgi:hypothetical protein
MIRCFAASLLMVGLSHTSLLAWQACELPCDFPVAASGQSVQFFEQMVFHQGATTVPGFQSGELSFGGHFLTAYVTQRVPVQIQRVDTYRVLVFVDGRPRFEERERVATETIFVEQLIPRTINLPQVTGRWQAIDLCLFSWWNCVSVGRGGLIIGGGATAGGQLTGSIVCVGVDGLPAGVYHLTSGEPGAGGEAPPP